MNDDINLILAAYSDAAARPGGTRLEEWVRRYPQHERTLVQYAVYDLVFERGVPCGEETPAQEALFLARAKTIRERMMADPPKAPLTGLLEAAKARGLSVAALARELQLGVPEVVKLDRRLLRAAALPKKLVERLAQALHLTFAEVAAYLRRPPTLSAQASYRADRAPRLAGQEVFADAIEASRNLTDEQKAYWRAELNDLLGDTE